MKRHRSSLGFLPLAAAITWTAGLTSGCASEVPARKGRRAVLESSGGYSIVSDSVLDAANHHLSTVKVTATFNSKRGVRFHSCSGVVVDAQLVLTAGHCVCQPHPGVSTEDQGTFIIDASQCAETATITTVRYKPLTEKQVGGYREDELSHPCRVLRVHEHLLLQGLDPPTDRAGSEDGLLAAHGLIRAGWPQPSVTRAAACSRCPHPGLERP
jgi:hypothetical protein